MPTPALAADGCPPAGNAAGTVSADGSASTSRNPSRLSAGPHALLDGAPRVRACCFACTAAAAAAEKLAISQACEGDGGIRRIFLPVEELCAPADVLGPAASGDGAVGGGVLGRGELWPLRMAAHADVADDTDDGDAPAARRPPDRDVAGGAPGVPRLAVPDAEEPPLGASVVVVAAAMSWCTAAPPPRTSAGAPAPTRAL